MALEVFVAVTDQRWFDFLAGEAGPDGQLDEVNFWSPRSLRPLRSLDAGDPFFLRLKKPHDAIAGYGFFAHFATLTLRQAWDWFGAKNGDPDEASFLRRIGGYRGVDLFDPRAPRAPVGCTILRDVRLWPRERWIPWGEAEGWSRNVVRGRTERDPARVRRLLHELTLDHRTRPVDLAEAFELVEDDERAIRASHSVVREGQGTFRARLLDAYGRRCAITGEHTEVVLDAAHIQPYLGARSNHPQNGLLLTKEFHALFDEGYVTVTPDLEVRVSPRLREEWDNGHRYYPYDRERLRAPSDPARAPARSALEWHGVHRFRD